MNSNKVNFCYLSLWFPSFLSPLQIQCSVLSSLLYVPLLPLCSVKNEAYLSLKQPVTTEEKLSTPPASWSYHHICLFDGKSCQSYCMCFFPSGSSSCSSLPSDPRTHSVLWKQVLWPENSGLKGCEDIVSGDALVRKWRGRIEQMEEATYSVLIVPAEAPADPVGSTESLQTHTRRPGL